VHATHPQSARLAPQDVKRQRGHYERAALRCRQQHLWLNTFVERHGRVPRGVAYLPDTLVLAFDGASFGRGVPAFAQVRGTLRAASPFRLSMIDQHTPAWLRCQPLNAWRGTMR
jgi:hypothetical protein